MRFEGYACRTVVSLDLEQAFARIQQELTRRAANGTKVEFRVISEGQRRPLHPLLRDEIYRIGREAVTNAFRHARANHIELELKYGSNQFRLLVRDDGCGIEPEILLTGRDGHLGALWNAGEGGRVGRRLHVFSRASAGPRWNSRFPAALLSRISRTAGQLVSQVRWPWRSTNAGQNRRADRPHVFASQRHTMHGSIWPRFHL